MGVGDISNKTWWAPCPDMGAISNEDDSRIGIFACFLGEGGRAYESGENDGGTELHLE